MKIVSFLAFLLIVVGSASLAEDSDGWIRLDGLSPWKPPHGSWLVAGGAKIRSENEKLLEPIPGEGAIVNGPTGRTINITSKESFGDVEVDFEFLIPKGSNSGIKFHAHYEIQIMDSWGKAKVTASDCGGVYPRAELLPKYHHIDQGFPPLRNASKPPGDWQRLEVIFRSPRFDADGKKVAHARFERVKLNGQVVQENLDVPYPTGHAWHNKEMTEGPLLLQADHGPAAFRNMRARRLKAAK